MAIKKEIMAFACEKCGKIYLQEYLADICCKQYHCEYCGKPTEKYRLACPECHEKNLFNKAKKMSYSEYIRQFPDNMIWDGDEYFSELEDMADSYICNDKPVPDYVWGTESYRVEIDIENVISQAEDDSNLEDFSFDTYGDTKDLIEFVNKWNERNGTTAYAGEYHIAIVLTEQEKELFKNESD